MMERLRRRFRRAVYRIRNDRRHRVLLVSGLIGLGILVSVLADGNSIRLSGRELALLVGGIFIGVEYCLGYQLDQERGHNDNEDTIEVIYIDRNDD